ncbi:MAG: hypothetical protein ACP5NL_06725 [Thermoplasmata archaeon]
MNKSTLKLLKYAISALLIFALISYVYFSYFSNGTLFSLAGYMFIVLLFFAWNLGVVLNHISYIYRNRSRSALLSTFFVMIGAIVTFVTILFLGFSISLLKTTYFIAYLLAILYFVYIYSKKDEKIKIGEFLIVIYNIFGVLTVIPWYFAGSRISIYLIFHALLFDNALFQMYNFSVLSLYFPLFLLPPLLAPYKMPFEQASKKMGLLIYGIKRFAYESTRIVAVYFILFMLIFIPIANSDVQSLNSLSNYVDDSYAQDLNMSFAAVASSFTGIAVPPSNWATEVQKEIVLVKSANISYVRFDISTELLNNSAGFADLATAISWFEQNNTKIILAPIGNLSWANVHPSLSQLNSTIFYESMLLVDIYHPSYIFPFLEPNGQLQQDLGKTEPASVWIPMISYTAKKVHEESPTTKVLIEVAVNSQGPPLFKALENATVPINAVGIDIYPVQKSDFNAFYTYYNISLSNHAREFWISEFGVDSLLFGENAQANSIGYMLSIASKYRVSGFCVYMLDDNSATHLGIVYNSYTLKKAYNAYTFAISEISGV